MSDLFANAPADVTPFSEAEKLSWIRLIRSEGIGPITFYKLIERYGSATRALEELPTLNQRSKAKHKAIAPLSTAEKEFERATRYNAHIICATENTYPLALSAIDDAPPVVTVRGRTELLNQQSIGIVGARNASLNARKFTETLASDLGKASQIVVSGLARGIDTSAHKGSLESGTVAVIAGGIDVIYPEENTNLYEEICEKGCVIAESPFGQVPFAQSFPKRNRIISGLSAGTVVVEASLRSGSLITARLAAEQGRDVFAVPGFPMDPRAQGPNKLIADGAILVQKADDILNAINSFTRSAPRSFKELPQPDYQNNYEEDEGLILSAQDKILEKLSHMPVQQDDLLRDLHLDPASFSSALLELEITGQIQRHAGGKIGRAR